MVIADKFTDTMRKTQGTLLQCQNFDESDPQFISLYEEFRRILNKKNIEELNQKEMNENIIHFEKIYKGAREINRENNLLKEKFSNDEKFARVFKNVMRTKNIDAPEINIIEAFQDVKKEIDQNISNNSRFLENEDYFSKLVSSTVFKTFEDPHKIKLKEQVAESIVNQIIKEYNLQRAG